MTRSVLCFGDSNTWGRAVIPRPDDRYAPDERWPGVMRGLLGTDWLVIEEGMPGRTTVHDDPIDGAERNGKTYLLPCLLSHRPLDAVIIMLGTNDLKARFHMSAWEVAECVGTLVKIVKLAGVGRNGGVPEIVMVTPPIILEHLPSHAETYAGGHEKSRDLTRHYKAVAEREGVRSIDAGALITSSPFDGFHLELEAHDKLGRALAEMIGKL